MGRKTKLLLIIYRSIYGQGKKNGEENGPEFTHSLPMSINKNS